MYMPKGSSGIIWFRNKFLRCCNIYVWFFMRSPELSSSPERWCADILWWAVEVCMWGYCEEGFVCRWAEYWKEPKTLNWISDKGIKVRNDNQIEDRIAIRRLVSFNGRMGICWMSGHAKEIKLVWICQKKSGLRNLQRLVGYISWQGFIGYISWVGFG